MCPRNNKEFNETVVFIKTGSGSTPTQADQSALKLLNAEIGKAYVSRRDANIALSDAYDVKTGHGETQGATLPP